MIEEAQFNRATLDCMTTLRRRLKQDLGVTIRLAEPDALTRLLELSQNSTIEAIRELGAQLADMTRAAAEPPPESGSSLGQGAIAARQYRMRAERPPEAEPPPATGAVGGVRIYRGQIIRT